MLELRTLGVVELAGSDETAAATLLAQPKPIALVAYLAFAQPRGFHRRDSIIALFWPELDTERARAALRRTLHRVRADLGTAAILTRGDEIAVDSTLVRCDAVSFEAAIDEGDLDTALARYRGEFMAGLHVKDAPELERWIGAERDRLRERAATACIDRAERMIALGDRSGSVWSARGVSLLPHDEHLFRRHLLLLRELGDDATALQAYEAFADWLDHELGAAPSPATQAIAAELRRRAREPHTPRVSRPPSPPISSPVHSPVHEAPAATSSDAPNAPMITASPIVSDEPTHARPRSAWRMLAGAVALLALVATGIAALSTIRRGEPGTTESSTRVAVLPFEVRGGQSASYLGEGMVDLLSATLDGAGPLHTVDPHALLSYLGREPGISDALERGRRAAEHFDATRFVLGSIVTAGDRVAVRATMYDAAGVRLGTAESTMRERDLLPLVDTLTRQLLAERYQSADMRLARLAIGSSGSLAAVKSYLRGTQEMRAGRFGAAADAFRAALAADSAFALAHYGFSMAVGWSTGGRDRAAVIAAARATELSESLSSHDRELLRAHFEAWNGRLAQAEERYLRVLDAYPDDVDASHELADLQFHSGPRSGHALGAARAAFTRVLGVHALRPSALLHLARIAASEEDTLALDSLARAAVEFGGGDARAFEISALHAYARGDVQEQGRIERELQGADVARVWSTAWNVAEYTGNWVGAERIALLLTSPSHPRESRGLGWIAIAHVRAAAGRPAAATAALDRLAGIDEPDAIVLRATLSILPFLPFSRADLLRARGDLARWNGKLLQTGRSPLLIDYAGSAAIKERLIATLDARARGDSTPGVWTLPWPPNGTLPVEQVLLPDASLQRLLHAERLRARGATREAESWYASLPEPDAYDVSLLAPAALGRARAARAGGDTAAATRWYTRAARLWRDAEPSLGAQLVEIRKRASSVGR